MSARWGPKTADFGMIRWGVVGPGSIATGFADAMQQAEGGTIVAVASRSAERPPTMAAKCGSTTSIAVVCFATTSAKPPVAMTRASSPIARRMRAISASV